MKVHITLVGGQTMPIYQGIRYAHPDFILFICSKETLTKVDYIKALLPDIQSFTAKFDTTDMKRIREDAEVRLKEYENDEVTINISGGTKMWAYYFTKIFSRHGNAHVFYIDQSDMAYDLNEEKTKVLESVGIADQLSLNGVSATPGHRTIDQYDENDKEVIRQLESFRDKHVALLGVFDHLIEDMSKHTDRTESRYGNGHFIYTKEVDEDGSKLEKIDIEIADRKGNHSFSFHSKNARSLVLNAGWFEVKVASILSKWQKCKDIWLNCTFNINGSGKTAN